MTMTPEHTKKQMSRLTGASAHLNFEHSQGLSLIHI